MIFKIIFYNFFFFVLKLKKKNKNKAGLIKRTKEGLTVNK